MKDRKLFLFTLMISASLFQSCAQTRLEVTPSPNVSSPTTTPISTPLSESTISSIFPLCYLEPQVAYRGTSIHVKAESLPANRPILIFVGTQQVETGLTDSTGSANVNIVIPSDTPPGLSQVSVHAEGTAVAADCVLNVLSNVKPSPTISAISSPKILATSSTEMQDSISIWKSFIGLRGQDDHLIFHVVINDTSAIPLSLQILDADTGQVTDSFPLYASPIPNLCTAKPIQGRSYYRTNEVFFENLPKNFEDRLMGTSFTYLVVVEQPTGKRVSIAITEPPGGCTNLVQ